MPKRRRQLHRLPQRQRLCAGQRLVPRQIGPKRLVGALSIACCSFKGGVWTAQDGASVAAEPAKLRSSTGGTQPGHSSKARSPVRSPASKPSSHKTREPPKGRAPGLASEEALTLAVRSFMRSNSGIATWPAPAARGKAPVPAEVKHRPQGHGEHAALPNAGSGQPKAPVPSCAVFDWMQDQPWVCPPACNASS
jgi:hypothetical protein